MTRESASCDSVSRDSYSLDSVSLYCVSLDSVSRDSFSLDSVSLDSVSLDSALRYTVLSVVRNAFKTTRSEPFIKHSVLFYFVGRDRSVSYIMETECLLGIKLTGRGVDHSPASSAEVKERVGLNFYSTSGSSWSLLV